MDVGRLLSKAAKAVVSLPPTDSISSGFEAEPLFFPELPLRIGSNRFSVLLFFVCFSSQTTLITFFFRLAVFAGIRVSHDARRFQERPGGRRPLAPPPPLRPAAHPLPGRGGAAQVVRSPGRETRKKKKGCTYASDWSGHSGLRGRANGIASSPGRYGNERSYE